MSDVEPAVTVLVVGTGENRGPIEAEIGSSPRLLVVGAVGPEHAAATVEGRAPDVVVVVAPLDGGVADVAAGVASSAPACRVLVVGTSGDLAADVGDPETLIDSWVGGVVRRDELPGGVADAVEAIAAGEAFLDAPLAAAVLGRHRDGRSRIELAPTEEEVLGRLAGGESADTIADEYAVSPRLVRLHASGPLVRLQPRP